MHTTRRLPRARSALVIGIAALAACSSVDRGGGDRSAELGTWSDLPVMGLSFRSTIEAATAAIQKDDDAVAAVTKACLTDRGYPDATAPPGSGEILATDNFFRPTDRADAERNGLNRSRLIEVGLAQSTTPLDATATQPSANQDPGAMFEALTECTQRAGDGRGSGVAELSDSYRTEVLDDAAVRRARASWRTCMADAGYDAEGGHEVAAMVADMSLAQSIHDLPVDEQKSKLAALLDRERPAAVAMVDCDTSAYGPMIPAWARLEQTWLDDHAAGWNDLTEKGRLLFGVQLGV